jgi:hypothetical protein
LRRSSGSIARTSGSFARNVLCAVTIVAPSRSARVKPERQPVTMRPKPVESSTISHAIRAPSSRSTQRSSVEPAFVPTRTKQRSDLVQLVPAGDRGHQRISGLIAN